MLFAVAVDLDARQVLGGPVPLVEGVRQTLVTAAAQFSLADNGALVYAPGRAGAGGAFSLAWVTRTGDATPTAAPPRNYGNARVSPDGTRVAATVFDPDNIDVWIWRLDQGPLTRLTFDDAFDGFPLWTPDSARVVFFSQREGGGLFWKAADGTGEVERLLESTARPVPWGWDTDGRVILDTTPGDIGVLAVEGDRTVEMLLETQFEEDSPALSPDGRWLAYQSNESGQPEIYVQPFPNLDDGKWQVSTASGFYPVWSPDGRELFYLAPPGRLMVAEVQTDPALYAGTPAEAFAVDPVAMGQGGGRQYDVAPAGDRFLTRAVSGTQGAGDDEVFSGLILVENWFEELKARVPVN